MSLTTKGSAPAKARVQIQHIATLARIDIKENEIEEYSDKLSSIIGYIGQLQEVDIVNIEPTAQVTGLENIMREDIIANCDQEIQNTALKQAAEREGGQIKVRRILD